VTGDVLVVEDDDDVREVVAHVLGQHGYPVRTAGNGLEALAALRGGTPPALILLDLTMPVMSGYEMLEVMAADPALAAIPVIAMTAGATRRVEIGGSRIDMLPKPVSIGALLAIIERVCAVPS
jgi:CheY-like chemotaxis protein